MSRKQRLLVAFAAVVVIAGIAAILTSGSLLGVAVLAIAGSILIWALRTRSPSRDPGMSLGPEIPDDDLEARVAEWAESAGTSLPAASDLGWDEVDARLDSDAQYQECKREYEAARSTSAREEAFSRILRVFREKAEAAAAGAPKPSRPDTG